MKKLFSLVALALITTMGVNADVVQWKVSSAPTVGTAFNVSNDGRDVLQIAFGSMNPSKGDTEWTTGSGKVEVTYSDNKYTFETYTTTSQTNGGNSSDYAADGSSQANYVAFVPKFNGTLVIVVQNNGGKNTCLYEDGKQKAATLIGDGTKSIAFNGSEDMKTLNGNSNYSGGVKVEVKAGSLYTISVDGSKGRWEGVIYDYEIPTATAPAEAPTFTPDGGDIMALSTITLTSDGTVYYQWSDEANAPEISAEGWTKGTSVTVPYEVGTKYLHAYATNGDDLESEVVTKEFNITDIVLTAETNKTWDFANKTNWPLQTLSSVFYNDNLIINATSEKTVTIAASRIELGGGGAADSRNITFKVAPRSRIKVTCVSSSSSASRTLNVDKDVFGSTIGTIAAPGSSATNSFDYTGSEEATLIIYSSASGIHVSKIVVEPMPTSETKTVTVNGWATYIPVLDAQFKDGDAYIVTNVNATNVTVESVTAVPAGTPVLLKDAGEKTINFIDTAAPVTNNMLSVCDGTQNDNKVAYVLAKDGDSAGFKKWTGEISALTGHAVLWLDGEVSTARGFFALDGEATGIQNVAPSVEDGAIYDLQGRRVAQPKAGLYIVNGKKVVVK